MASPMTLDEFTLIGMMTSSAICHAFPEVRSAAKSFNSIPAEPRSGCGGCRKRKRRSAGNRRQNVFRTLRAAVKDFDPGKAGRLMEMMEVDEVWCPTFDKSGKRIGKHRIF